MRPVENPSFQEIPVFGGERVAVFRRHANVNVVAADSLPQIGVIQISGDDETGVVIVSCQQMAVRQNGRQAVVFGWPIVTVRTIPFEDQISIRSQLFCRR